MKNKLFAYSLLLTALLFTACNKNKQALDESPVVINNQLTSEEKQNGVMTPELMWKFRRLGDIALSPDGSELLYTVTDIDLETEKRVTNIYKMSSSGGDPVQLTQQGGNSPQWSADGKTIYYIGKEGLASMDANGSNKKNINGLDDFETYIISPDNSHILFTRRVKLDETANEKYGLEKANVRIIDNLMYRHWDYWSDYSYSHIFVAKLNGNNVSDAKDIMEGQKFESPTAPYFDGAEIAWSPDGKYVAYTTKRLTGVEDAKSTNTDIFLYDISTGNEVNISKGNKGFDKYPVFSPDGSKIAFLSMEREGYESDLDRLFVYDIASDKRTWVTQGWDFDVENVTWIDNEIIWFTCAYLGTGQIFKTNINYKGVDKITEGKHELGPLQYANGTLISRIMSMSLAPEIAKINMGNGAVEQISFINKHIYDNIKMGETEERYIKTSDNKDLQMWIIYPPDFDPNKKYPTLLYCKGGPQGALGQDW